ncbi:thioesterase II family protein [Saccharomonospora cyanea]|uniref:Putative thioesterase involved in non-ribosomal peptide biosynthesis n=1 Tax=Saccharomonospora cyanea NA-134 TaxID=882082 RepID=H5XPU0_9PSEU|nr:alpha/beta fold hydrolase [Saccharomonospora cyanea]EHR61169.1 putative thioesterase involved in non-ribosomal peptide biosynthesis [Saccharomonospora cyanea NA-134]
MDSWFFTRRPRPDAAVRLYCLPYAGGGASVFHDWPDLVGPDVEVHAVALPGRERRFGEDPEFDLTELAEAFAAHDDSRPFALYGHSLGGLVGFEVIRWLRRTGARLPVRLYAGACRAPHVRTPGPFLGLSRLPDDELVRQVADGGGIPAEVLAEPELMELVLPALRADFARIDDYEYVPGPPIEVPVVAFAGRTDHAVPLDQVRAWAPHTAAGFHLTVLDGGHFFLRESCEELVAALSADLRAAVAVRGE